MQNIIEKRIVLCADDYGQGSAISRGIINLIEKKRLTATSCLVNMPYWLEHSKWLLPYHSQIDIGLHFNLTEGSPLSKEFMQQYGNHLPSLAGLIIRTHLGKFSLPVIEAECHAQLDCFYQTMGFLPDYLDGHHYVHQFPIIREAVISVYKKRLKTKKAYLRLANESVTLKDWFKCFKKVIIKQVINAKAFKHTLLENQIPYNQSFAGIYEFNQAKFYSKFFKHFLRNSTDCGLIMCHPGLFDQNDPMSVSRLAEYQYLASDQFLQDCATQRINLSRFNHFAYHF